MNELSDADEVSSCIGSKAEPSLRILGLRVVLSGPEDDSLGLLTAGTGSGNLGTLGWITDAGFLAIGRLGVAGLTWCIGKITAENLC